MSEELEAEIRALRKQYNALRRGADAMQLYTDGMPDELLTPYPVDWDTVETPRDIQGKYKERARNCERSWSRIQQFTPELLRTKTPKKRVFEMSTAHAGMLEVARHFGHDVLGNDYLNFVQGQAKGEGAVHRKANEEITDRDFDDYGRPIPKDGSPVESWAYEHIIKSIDMPIKLFDGGMVPYPIDDKSHDIMFCMQAIEHYCHPDEWDKVLAEFCRITTETIVVLLNKLPPHLEKQPDYVEAFERAKIALRDYDENGFECVSVHMYWGEALGYRLDCRAAIAENVATPKPTKKKTTKTKATKKAAKK